ncbi:MAG: thioredoxin family protein [Candidatus Sericytochromatia bacterium]|jgi:glutaredoxin|nr:thioredoxin family protein [Candidatus Sericytochromatia bacterium]MBT9549032.1 thioredoxin family protein [Candidatus Sericytochromatia bacterium]
MQKAIYYHAGCPVCLEAEDQILAALDSNKYQVEIIDLREEKAEITKAENLGVKSVPALVLNGLPFHINFGAALVDLKNEVTQ